MIWIRKHRSNPGVTDYYLETIGDAYIRSGNEVRYFIDWNDYNPGKNDITVISTYYEAIKLIMKRKKFVWWIQGIRPEESYAVHRSRIRKIILDAIEFIEIRKTVFPIFVSMAMKDHYERKYHYHFKTYYVMPCNNDSMKESSFFDNNKYKNNVFCYAGSLDTWQCVDEALALYKKIENHFTNTKLLLLVRDKETVSRMLEEHQISKYEIDFVSIDELPNKLKGVKFGFIIRDDLELNKVATPTKLMTYIGNGVIPIVSNCLEGLIENLEETQYFVKITDNMDESPIIKMMEMSIEPEQILEEYWKVYNEHYNREKHVESLSKVLPV